MKRIGIFCFYDRQGIADRSVTTLLDGMKKVLDELVIVCNGTLSEEGKNILSNYSDEIYFRENAGFDAAAYKFAVEKLGKERLCKFDEAVFFNDSVFGPVYPFEEMFDKMESNKELDFWGISSHGEYDEWIESTKEYRHFPEHIQSYFIAYRRSLLNSDGFYEYWKTLPVFTDFKECVQKYETQLTKYFNDLGFRSSTYLNFSDYGYAMNLLISDAVKCIKELRCPVFKKKQFYRIESDIYQITMGEETYELIRYLKENGLYDTDIIYENLIRRNNVFDIYRNLGLNFVVFDIKAEAHNDEKRFRKAVFAYLEDFETVESSLAYVMNVSDDTDIYITTPKSAIIDEINKRIIHDPHHYEVNLTDNNTGDIAYLLVNYRSAVLKYDLCCFYHDRCFRQMKQGVTEKSRYYLESESILSSRGYVENLTALFEKDKYIGVLCPTIPLFGQYRSYPENEWGTDNYSKVTDLLKMTGLDASLVRSDVPPIGPFSNCLWFRTAALKPLFEFPWKYEDFNSKSGNGSLEFELIYPFVAQLQGYYFATVMPEKIAAYQINILKYFEKSKYSYDSEIAAIKNSTTWKVGKFVTFIPRKIKDFLKRK